MSIHNTIEGSQRFLLYRIIGHDISTCFKYKLLTFYQQLKTRFTLEILRVCWPFSSFPGFELILQHIKFEHIYKCTLGYCAQWYITLSRGTLLFFLTTLFSYIVSSFSMTVVSFIVPPEAMMRNPFLPLSSHTRLNREWDIYFWGKNQISI